jgi:hypothetical protein
MERRKSSKYMLFHQSLMGYIFHKDGSIIHKYELFTMGHSPEKLKKGVDDIEIIVKGASLY